MNHENSERCDLCGSDRKMPDAPVAQPLRSVSTSFEGFFGNFRSQWFALEGLSGFLLLSLASHSLDSVDIDRLRGVEQLRNV